MLEIIELSLSGKTVWYTNGINRSVMIKKKSLKRRHPPQLHPFPGYQAGDQRQLLCLGPEHRTSKKVWDTIAGRGRGLYVVFTPPASPQHDPGPSCWFSVQVWEPSHLSGREKTRPSAGTRRITEV